MDIAMNERIKELALQAGFKTDKHGHLFGSDDIEKFAELIVRECLNNMNNEDGDLDFAIWKTKNDFGIE